MRGVLAGDLDHAVAACLAQPHDKRAAFARRLIEDAHLADKVRKRLGRPLAGKGTGSLMSAAALHPRVRSTARCDPTYCAALQSVLSALASWRADQLSLSCRTCSAEVSGRP